jgi:hypothetical protein
MECIKCGKEQDGSFGSGKYCSKSCANSRVRTDEVKKKISIGVRNNEYWTKDDWKIKMIESNQNPEKIAKSKNTWKSKRNWNDAHIQSIKRWIKDEKSNTCEGCGLNQWNDKPLVMEVDHIDGNVNNNNVNNLKVLCPNCHSQTPTWRRRKG